MKHYTVTRLILIVNILIGSANGYSQSWNPSYTIGTVTGKYNFALNQTPDQLVEIRPAGIPNTGFTYQWEYCYTPTGTFASVTTGTGSQSSSYTPGAMNQTIYLRRKTISGTLGTLISNVVKLSLASVNWEDINYVREHEVTTTGVTTWSAVDQLPIGQKFQTTNYLDGLGRSIEKVSREIATPAQGTTLWGDVIQFSQYDAYGREPKKYLTYTSSNQSGKYKIAPLTDQPAYYANAATYNETSAYNTVTFDNSPLKRISNIKESGTAWSASGGNSVTYDVNSAADNVQIFTNDYVQGNPPVNKGSYPANSLYKLAYTDVNNKQVVEYTNMLGQLILKKVQIDPTPTAAHVGWICTYSIYDDFGLLRYQIQPEGVKYLDANSWSFAGANGQQVLKEYCFQYNFDDKGRTIWKKAPGANPLNMLYDIRDRVVFMQDGNQVALSTPQWTANLYDDLDRPVLTTLYNTTESISALQSDIAASVTVTTINSTTPSTPIIDLVVTNRNTTISAYTAQSSIIFGPGFSSGSGDSYTAQINAGATTPAGNIADVVFNNPISQANLSNTAVTTILKYFFYDNYNFSGVKSFDNGFTNTTAYNTSDPNVIPLSSSKRSLSLITGTLTRILGTNIFLVATNYYDEKGNNIQKQEDNIKTGTDVTTTQYHFDGRILSVCKNHSAPGTDYAGFIVLTKYLFDKIGRVSSIQKQYGNNPFKTLSSYDYDDLGRVQTKHLDPGYTSGGNTDLEALNYTFNIHHQIIGINKDYALKTPANYNKWGHFFGLYLGFDNRDNIFASQQLNGQVTGLLWNTQGDDAQRKYDYTYDNAGRLVKALYTEQQHPGDGYASTKMDFSVTGVSGQITYDLNGNLLTMLQKGVVPGTPTPITIDDLRYAYSINGSPLTNRLYTVTDQMVSSNLNGLFGDFKDGSNGAAGDYVYDANGNMVIDLNKNVQSLNNGAPNTNGISYNYMDKPDQIRIVGKGTIKIVYSADGEKLQRVYIPEAGGNSTITSYINEFVYQETAVLTLTSPAPFKGTGNSLAYINFEEGRIRVMTPVSQTNGYDGLTENGNIPLPNGKSGVFDYFIMDYQKNVRMILTEETHSAMNTCTMETSRASAEDPVFGQPGASNEVETTRIPTPSSWSSNSTVGSYVSRLGSLAGHTLGPNVLQKVMAGDLVSAQVQYYYQTPPTSTSNNLLPELLSSLAQAISGGPAASSLVKGNSSAITSQLNGTNGFVNIVQPTNPPGSIPQAYLTILFFDERFNFISSADGGVYQQQVLSSVTPTSAPLALVNEKAPKNGYVYIYVSNRSDQFVYFDNLKVGIVAGNIIEENHYYAYGLKIAAISSKKLGDAAEGKLKNPYLYNEKEMLDEDADLNWYDYGFRNYDPQIARFVQLDPLTDDYPELSPYQYASCEPIANIDLDGLESASVVKSLAPVTVIGHSVKTVSKGMSTAARLGLIAVRGGADALANANSLGIYDFFGGNHTSSYDDPQEQIAYIRGQIGGYIAAGAQGASEMEVGGGTAALAGWTGVGLAAGGLVALHGAGTAAVATANAAKSYALLQKLYISSNGANPTSNTNNNSNSSNNNKDIKPNEGIAKKHGGTNHDQAINDRVAELKNDGTVIDIRKNQVQVDINGKRVGNNRPDIQYKKYNVNTEKWEKFNIEYDNTPANSVKHGTVIKANDPNSIIELNLLKK